MSSRGSMSKPHHSQNQAASSAEDEDRAALARAEAARERVIRQLQSLDPYDDSDLIRYLEQRLFEIEAEIEVYTAALDAPVAEMNSNAGQRASETIDAINNTGFNSISGPEAVRNVFGRVLSDEEIHRLAGAQPGDRVSVEASRGNAFTVKLAGPSGHEAKFTVARDGGDIVVHNTYVRNTAAKTAASGRDVIRAFDNFRSLGINRLEATAARGRDYNGYYTWALLGFTGPIPTSILGAAQAQFGRGITQVQQIMQQPGGRTWWKLFGTSWQATFDFSPGSYSMTTLNRFRRQR